jgi:GNAT superfamily N-acetyltransferase
MHIRDARIGDAEKACAVVRRSIVELCGADHRSDAETIALWLANKTANNMRRWIEHGHVLVATQGTAIAGVAALSGSGEITLNYVSPDARFRGISKALLARLEGRAAELGLTALTLQSTATALRFYQSVGYIEGGPPTRGFGLTVGHPMVKHLSQPMAAHARAVT